jgi:hypothetical protein
VAARPWRLSQFMTLVWHALKINGRLASENDINTLVIVLAEALMLCESRAFVEFLGAGQSRFEQKQIAAMVAALAA